MQRSLYLCNSMIQNTQNCSRRSGTSTSQVSPARCRSSRAQRIDTKHLLECMHDCYMNCVHDRFLNHEGLAAARRAGASCMVSLPALCV